MAGSEQATLPWRSTSGAPRPPLPLPPGRMPVVRAGRPRKTWRYVGVYAPDVLLCAGRVSIGGIPQAFWAVWDRRAGVLRERTVRRAGGVEVGDAVRFAGDGVRCTLEVERHGEVVEVVSPHGASYIWTRKTIGRARGTVELDGRALEVDGPALTDESAGYHARLTQWTWSAGAGRTGGGREVLWNLVDGVHDDPRASEQAVWVDGVAQEPGPPRFDALDAIRGAGGEHLRFTEEARRERHDRLVLVDSAYCQPFGGFAGVLPGGVELASGQGVMERHVVRW